MCAYIYVFVYVNKHECVCVCLHSGNSVYNMCTCICACGGVYLWYAKYKIVSLACMTNGPRVQNVNFKKILILKHDQEMHNPVYVHN